MTAEIVIMNSEAVALAADSAVTTQHTTHSSKIFTSGNKLFALSEGAPVGILTYGNARFMAIPWETVIKEYRRKHGKERFPTLGEYAVGFCEFLAHEAVDYVTTGQQNDYAVSLVAAMYEEINDQVEREIRAAFQSMQEKDKGTITGKGVRDLHRELKNAISDQVIAAYYTNARNASVVEGSPSNIQRTINTALRNEMRATRERIFQIDFTSGVSRKLNYIGSKTVCGFYADISEYSYSPFNSGIAIAGFGEDEVFPAILDLDVEGITFGILKSRLSRSDIISPENNAVIMPFAQSEMIYQFMEGIAPQYDAYIIESLVKYIDGYSDNIITGVTRNIQNIDASLLHENLRQFHPQVADSFVSEFKEFRRSSYSQDIIDTVSVLPKEQLAEMAEALINLTTLKRRVSPEEETVGGPTDVALITKGDGMVWIKRKHYFPSELNHAYFRRT